MASGNNSRNDCAETPESDNPLDFLSKIPDLTFANFATKFEVTDRQLVFKRSSDVAVNATAV